MALPTITVPSSDTSFAAASTSMPGMSGSTLMPLVVQRNARRPAVASLAPTITEPVDEAPRASLRSPPPERWPRPEIDVPPPVQRAASIVSSLSLLPPTATSPFDDSERPKP